ncbi:MAG: CDP-alcohol phosphatidyltransferase family protein [Candidatus Staskawiczbacteria bacterium]|nr:CDP-alcohol phosphatidyltransferase family protein [Candidatus Staskawiczbacteria bacterium]
MNNANLSWLIRNTANIITLTGIFFCQVIKWIIFFHTKWTSGILVFAAGVAATDWFDGKVARFCERKGYAGSVSDFGKAVDRFRDKDFQITMLLFLLWHPTVDHPLKWFFCPLVFAEIILLGTLWKEVRKNADASATNWGKWKMVSECVVIMACLLIILAREHGMAVPSYVIFSVLGVLLAATLFATMSVKGHIANCRRTLPSLP